MLKKEDLTASLARSITWAGSKQTFFVGYFMVDRNLVNDFFRAYAYFRWIDDIVDVSIKSKEDSINFIRRQRELIEFLYMNEPLSILSQEEEMMADLVRHDNTENSRLKSFILNMFAIIEFDSNRKGRFISQQELEWYSNTLGRSVTDGLQYFINNNYSYPKTDNRLSAALGAHITHLLRDMLIDIDDGFINIPHEYMEIRGNGTKEVESHFFRSWVKSRVELARYYFSEGKCYLGELDVLRCKIVGYWYCARFESVLDTIKRDDFILRSNYQERRNFSTMLKIVWLGFYVTLRHIKTRMLRYLQVGQ
ncbi:squalene/phytoene synthase family protein [Chloroflexota bacterium]